MSHRHGISEQRLRALLSAVDPEGPTGPGEFIPADFLRAITGIIGCDEASFQVMDSGRRTVLAQFDSSPVDLAEDLSADPSFAALEELFWAAFWSSLSCSYPQRTGDHRTVTRLSDFNSGSEHGGAASAYLTQAGIRHEMMVPLPPDGRWDERILLFRDEGPDFTEQDVLLMSLLRPHIVALRRQQSRRPIPQLTPRQLQILELVAAGCTNRQVARSLGVAPATIRKHLENTFERLEVSSRSAAIVKVLPLLELRSNAVPDQDHFERADRAIAI